LVDTLVQDVIRVLTEEDFMKLSSGVLIAASMLFATPASAESIEVGGWTLNRDSDSCMLYARFLDNSTLTVYATPEDFAKGELTFVVQNPKWQSLNNSALYKLDVEFDNLGEWSVTAMASKDLDRDGPGLMFIRSTNTNKDGDNFLAEFALSNVIHIRRNGTAIVNLNLSGTHKATLALGRCMRSIGATADPFAGDTPDDTPTPAPSSTGRTKLAPNSI
jgi:hypothetical protein